MWERVAEIDGGRVNRTRGASVFPGMKRPRIVVTLRDGVGVLRHLEVRSAFNAGVRTSEAAVRELAHKEGTRYEGGRPTRVGQRGEQGDTYSRRWASRCGRVIVASVEVAEVG